MKAQLDKYGKDIPESYNSNEWRDVKNMDIEIEKHKKYADETFKKNKRENIRLSQNDIIIKNKSYGKRFDLLNVDGKCFE